MSSVVCEATWATAMHHYFSVRAEQTCTNGVSSSWRVVFRDSGFCVDRLFVPSVKDVTLQCLCRKMCVSVWRRFVFGSPAPAREAELAAVWMSAAAFGNDGGGRWKFKTSWIKGLQPGRALWVCRDLNWSTHPSCMSNVGFQLCPVCVWCRYVRQALYTALCKKATQN